jgi:hypothetical protein
MILRLIIVRLLIVIELLEMSRTNAIGFNDVINYHREDKGEQKTLLTIVQAITSDPEYLALTYEQQYSVIETILGFLIQYKMEKNSHSFTSHI